MFLVATLLAEDPTTNVYYKGSSIYFGFNEETFNYIENYDNFYPYYYSSYGGVYKRCSEFCLTCVEKNNMEHCLRCNNDKGYYIYKKEPYSCLKEDAVIERYNLNMTLKAFVQCEKGWIKKSIGQIECYDLCPGGRYLDPTLNNLCSLDCDSSNPYKVNSTKECVIECPYDSIEKNGYCTKIELAAIKEESIIVDIPKEDIFNYINVSSFSEEGKNIIGNDFVVQIYPMNSSLEENNTISSIDIGQCEDLLLIENNIPSNESLLISKIDIQEDNAIIPKVEYRLYDSQGTELNMSTCNGVPILISYPLINTDLIAKFEDAGTLSEQGFDIYDPQDSFYNDKCSSYSNGTVDVVLSDRRKDIYVDLSFCNEGCVYEGINYTTNKVNCNCDGNTKEIKNFDDFGNSMFEQTNLMLFKCYT